MKVATVFLLISAILSADAYSPMGITTKRSTMTMRRGRGSFKKEIGGGGGGGMGSSNGGSRAGVVVKNWIKVPNSSVKDLPKEEGKVNLLNTQAFLLVDKNTNPMGSVGVVKYESQTHCFSANCPSCKIPMTKAKCLPANEETGGKDPRISCDFCKATFNLKTGEQITSQESTGILGGIAKAVLSAQDSTPLPIYSLAEKDGKILFAMD